MQRRAQRAWWGMMACLAVSAAGAPAADEIRFSRDILPILSDNCFACHGPDENKRESGLRLDLAAGLLQPADSGEPPIVPGEPDQSPLVQRIFSTDADSVMPPPDSLKKLTDAQKELLKKWVASGARYERHWAFVAPVAPPVPMVTNRDWVRTPIDRFLLARLEQQGLSPRPEAGREVLIRRVALALTGLPPTPQEVDRFTRDTSAGAYDALVQRYLDSPRFGEEMARSWLDVARYADTHGLHLDNEREMWAYRDWVIRAFNQNLPFDQFTIEQLAGDLLPNPTTDQLIATGFNRCNVTTSEGGSIEAEFLFRYAVDRASTMAQAWLGLTAGCAVCHDHKYDPLTMREFYSLYAFFYNAADPAMDKNIRTTEPFLLLPTAVQQAELDQLRKEEATARQQLEEFVGRLESSDPAAAPRPAAASTSSAAPPESPQSNSASSGKSPEKSGGESPAPVGPMPVGPMPVRPMPVRPMIEDIWLDDLFPLGAKVVNTSRNASTWLLATEVDGPLGRRVLRQANAAMYQDKCEGMVVPLMIPHQATLSVWARLDPLEPPQAIMLELNSARGTRRAIWGDAERLGSGEVGTTERLRIGDLPPAGKWTRLEVSAEQLGLEAEKPLRGFTLAQFGGIVYWDGLTVRGELSPEVDPRASLTAWWKTRVGQDTPGVSDEVQKALKAGPTESLSPEIRREIQSFYLAFIARPATAEWQKQRSAYDSALVARTALEDRIPGTFIFRDLPQPRQAFVMQRGQYDKPGDKVEPGVPAIFPALRKSAPDQRANRLDLARWLVSPDHPLTARVAVNRLWQQFFGTGLVRTSYDFGAQGEPPSHPELLDWLAVAYVESGWNTKELIRLLVSSAAFRQDAKALPEVVQRDPENRWYGRGPRFRLDAEQIRDNALFVSGLLNLEMGGRGVKPYQPPNIWEPVGYADSNTRFYLQDHQDALYRRSIYCFLKRTAPPPFMSNFDGPNREQFCTRRERSNTPLQALQLMNDVQHFEAARAFAERIVRGGGQTPDDRITFAYRLAVARPPHADELALVRDTLQKYLARYQADAAAAQRVVQVGESSSANGIPAPEWAAYTLIANLILNLDETITRP